MLMEGMIVSEVLMSSSKEVPQLRSTVKMNSYFELKLHCNFPFCDDL
jgi:hypothetical protein